MNRSLFLMFLLAAGGFPVCISGQAPESPGLPGDPGREDAAQRAKRKHVPKDRIISEEYKLSNERIQKISDIIRKHFDNRENLNDDSIKAAILEEIGKIVPLTPSQRADVRSLPAIKESLQSRVAAKYPKTPEQVRKEAIAECDQKFAMAKPREKVVVYVMRGNVSQRYEGTFYGFGGGSLRINSQYIPIFDLTPETRVKFDKKYNETARQEYVDAAVHNYLAERLAYSESLFAEENKKIRQNNEKLGYILRRQEWTTARTIADEFLKEMQQEVKARAEREAVEKAAREKAKREGGGGNPENNQQQPPEGGAPL